MSKGKNKKAVEEEVKVEAAPVLAPEDLLRIYEDVAGQFPSLIGKAISRKEREESKLVNARLTYGEIEYDSFSKFSNL
jgi:hypothetical protein